MAKAIDAHALGEYIREGRRQFERVQRSFSVFGRNATEIVEHLKTAESDPARALQLMQGRSALRPGEGDWQADFWAVLDQRLHNVVAAAASLVDHTRPLAQFYAMEQDFVAEWTARNDAVRLSREAQFLRRLRNYLLHCGMAPVTQTLRLGHIGQRPFEAHTIQLSANGLLTWTGWSSDNREFICSFGGGPPLREVATTYANAMGDLYTWLFKQYEVLHPPGTAPERFVIDYPAATRDTPPT